MNTEHPALRPHFRLLPLAAAVGATLTALAVAGVIDARAQTTSEATRDLDTTVVTARKRVERTIDVPLSISVLDGDEIRDRGAARIGDVPVPNVAFFGAENNALPNFSVRGVQSQNRSNIGFDSGIGVYVDGVYMGRGAAFNQESFDIERVEFLRGPQGTLFGKNSIAGAISVTTKAPSKNLTASGAAEFGSDNLKRFYGYLSTPLGSDKVLGSVSAYSGKRDGYVTNLADGSKVGNEDAQAVRTKVLLQPMKSLDITFALDYLKDKSVAASSHVLAGYGFVAGAGDFTTNVDLPTLANRTVKGGSATVNYDLGTGHSLTSITSVRKLDTTRSNDTDVGPTYIVKSFSTSQQDQWSQELRIGTNRAATFEYVAGIYYYDQKASGSSASTFGPAAPVLSSIRNTTGNTFGDIDTRTYAAFANVDWNLSQRLTLSGGLRYTNEKKDLAYQQVVTFPSFLASSLPLEKDSFSTSNTTPLVSARWRLDKDMIAYATYSKGFRSGGWNVDNVTTGGPTTFHQTRFGDESLDNYEIGAKGVLLNGRIGFGATAFRMNYKDIQVTQLVQVLGGGGAVVGLVTNAGQARVDGVELEATLKPTPAFRLSAGFGYADARYTDYVDTRSNVPISFTGNKLNYAPRTTSNVTATYTVPTGIGSLIFRVDYNHVDPFYTGRDNTAAQRIPAKDIVNVRLTLIGNGAPWEVALYSNNVNDKRYIVSQGTGGFAAPVGAGTNQLVDYGRPRNSGIVASYTF